MNHGARAKSQRDLHAIESGLYDAVETARKRHDKARDEFRRVMKDVPTAMSPADGLLHIQTASHARSEAVEAYQVALKRFNDFIIDGIIPEDLDSN